MPIASSSRTARSRSTSYRACSPRAGSPSSRRATRAAAATSRTRPGTYSVSGATLSARESLLEERDERLGTPVVCVVAQRPRLTSRGYLLRLRFVGEQGAHRLDEAV